MDFPTAQKEFNETLKKFKKKELFWDLTKNLNESNKNELTRIYFNNEKYGKIAKHLSEIDKKKYDPSYASNSINILLINFPYEPTFKFEVNLDDGTDSSLEKLKEAFEKALSKKQEAYIALYTETTFLMKEIMRIADTNKV